MHTLRLTRFALLLVASALLLAALPATAQSSPIDQPVALTLQARPFESPLNVTETYRLPLLLEVTYSASAAVLNPNGFDIHLHVTDAPPWLSAVIQPEVIHVSPRLPQGSVVRQVLTAEVVVVASVDAPRHQHEILQVSAISSAGLGMRAGSTTMETPVAAAKDPLVEEVAETCDGHTSGGSSATTSGDGSVAPVTTQSVGLAGTAGVPLAIALGGSAAGALCGIGAVRWMRRR